MKIIVDDDISVKYPELAQRLEQLLVDAMQTRDSDGKLTLGCIRIDDSELIQEMLNRRKL